MRRRYDASRLNLIRLLPHLIELRLYDNSTEGDPDAGRSRAEALASLALGTHRVTARIRRHAEWAKPILAAAMKRAGRA